jgi:hypothetical protein
MQTSHLMLNVYTYKLVYIEQVVASFNIEATNKYREKDRILSVHFYINIFRINFLEFLDCFCSLSNSWQKCHTCLESAESIRNKSRQSLLHNSICILHVDSIPSPMVLINLLSSRPCRMSNTTLRFWTQNCADQRVSRRRKRLRERRRRRRDKGGD